MPDPKPGPIVVKVGGSLYDWPELGPRLLRMLEELKGPSNQPIIVVPGGGHFASAVRRLDRVHALDEKTSHWLAMQSLSIAARFLVAVLGTMATVVAGESPLKTNRIPVIDMFAVARSRPDPFAGMPRSWSVTSDSLAARFATLIEARELILLKSTELPAGITWQQAAQLGFVDPYFPVVLAERKKGPIQVRVVNLRTRS